MGKSVDNGIAQEELVKVIAETLFPKPTTEPAFRIEGNALIINTDGFLLENENDNDRK